MHKCTLAVTLAALTVVAAGCGGGGGRDVTSPSAANQIPNVAGRYSGPVTWTVDGVPFISMGMQLDVVHAGSQLTINGNINVENLLYYPKDAAVVVIPWANVVEVEYGQKADRVTKEETPVAGYGCPDSGPGRG